MTATLNRTTPAEQLAEYKSKKRAISVIGLGYVGLPLALELAKKFRVIGFDISAERVAMMQNGEDPSEELESSAFLDKDITFTADPSLLKDASFHIVAVPTPVSEARVPNLNPLKGASETVGRALKKEDIVVYESTVYPGCTEEDCIPILERLSGLKFGEDFFAGYSPERINPGDKEHTVDKILKIVSGSDPETLEVISGIYGAVITAGIYEASTIKVAEAAKVIENAQRDINISFVNELSMIFNRMGIDTQEVLAAAGTKWNFLNFRPGLVGGHCISVDPYYLLHKSKELGYDPQVIASGRRINDGMPGFIAKELTQLLLQRNINPKTCKVLVMGATFKENVADIRNSKIFDVIKELMEYGINVQLVDPHASPNEVAQEYKFNMSDEVGKDYDAIIVGVAHQEYKSLDMDYFRGLMKPNQDMILFDLKALYDKNQAEGQEVIWRLQAYNFNYESLSYFAHPTAVIDDNVTIGSGSKIWHFSHLMPGCVLGKGCNIGQNVVISPDVVLGNNVKVQNNVSIYTGVSCEDDVFLGPSCVFTNVINPRSAINRRGQYQKTHVGKGATIGANATIVCGHDIGAYAFIGAGAVVTKNVPPYALLVGNPAKQIGWMSEYGHRLEFDDMGQAVCPESGAVYRLIEEAGIKAVVKSEEQAVIETATV